MELASEQQGTAAQSTDASAYVTALLLAVGLGCISASRFFFGLAFWLVLVAGALIFCLAVRRLLHGPQVKWRERWANFTLVVLSLLFAAALAEGGIAVTQWLASQAARQDTAPTSGPLLADGALQPAAVEAMRSRLGVLVMPDAWARRPLGGASRDYYWHGQLHVHDANGFRRSEPFPAKDPQQFRVLVVGDSLTYGYGIAAEHSYSAVLETLLGERYRVEVLNLGVSGYQSADTLRVLDRFVPRLAPDLVIYGVCLNDFLPTGVGEYRADAYAFPLPDRLKSYFIDHSRLGQFLADRYARALLSLGLRVDFMDDILADFDDYQSRFARDVQAMADLVQGEHAIPMMAMVLHQFPELGGRAHRATQAAERHLSAAAINVVSSEPYFSAYQGRALAVSKWEGHPNELANALYASMLLPEVSRLPRLQPYEQP